MNDMYSYDRAFMGVTARSARSAEIVIGHLQAEMPISSIADFGCALGTWLAAWRRAGVADIIGVDGPYIRIDDLLIPREQFLPRNLVRPIDLGRRFDLVESIEVAEHLPNAAADQFVTCLTKHADTVLFSAAPPGQGGEHHINEQPYEYWQARFAMRGYRMLDCVRPWIIARKEVTYWYRFNLFLFVAGHHFSTLSPALRATEVPLGQRVRDVSPVMFRLRKQLIRRIPARFQNGMSRAMSRFRTGHRWR